MSKVYGYCRCSTDENKQDISRQVRELKEMGAVPETIFTEYISGMKENKVELQKLLNVIRSGDTLAVTELSRLTRSTKQLCDDYALRRELVCGYTFYSDKEEKEKAEEIFTELKKLLTDENLYSKWNSFYNRIALQSVSSERINESLYQLSDVYESYQEHFNNVYSKYLTPMLETEAGSYVKTLIREKMNPIDMFSFFGLIYFDFYNHTLRQVTA